MIKLLTAVAVALTLAAPIKAQPAFAPKVAEPGLYRVEPSHTRVLFSVSHFGITTFYGQFVGASGTLELNPNDLSRSQLDVSVPIDGVMTSNQKLNDELKGPAWFDARRYPAMTFHSTAIKPTQPGMADITGDLTLHGVTKQVTLRAKFTVAGVNPLDRTYATGFEGRGKIRRSDFGVSRYVPLVGDEVTIIVSAAFERAAG